MSFRVCQVSDRRLIFSVHILLIYKHLFYRYFVGQSVGQPTKGNDVKMPFLKISNSFASYGCCYPCFALIIRRGHYNNFTKEKNAWIHG